MFEAEPLSAYIPSTYSDKGIHIVVVTSGASGDMVHGVVIVCMKLDGGSDCPRSFRAAAAAGHHQQHFHTAENNRQRFFQHHGTLLSTTL